MQVLLLAGDNVGEDQRGDDYGDNGQDVKMVMMKIKVMVTKSTCELNIAIDLSFKKVRSSGGKLISYKMCELATFCEQVTVCVKTSRQRHSRSESSRAVWTFSQNLSVLVVSPIPKKKIIFLVKK